MSTTNGINPASGGAGGAAAGGVAGGGAGSGNQQLQQAFQTAIGEAQQTLAVSTQGQAVLNALRARPS
jgi:hypothetical protein